VPPSTSGQVPLAQHFESGRRLLSGDLRPEANLNLRPEANLNLRPEANLNLRPEANLNLNEANLNLRLI
jgi:hypothetical protein